MSVFLKSDHTPAKNRAYRIFLQIQRNKAHSQKESNEERVARANRFNFIANI